MGIHEAFRRLGFKKGIYSFLKWFLALAGTAIFFGGGVFGVLHYVSNNEGNMPEMPWHLRQEYSAHVLFQYPACPSHPGMMTGLENRTQHLLAERMWVKFATPRHAFIDIIGDCRFKWELSGSDVEEWRIEKWLLIVWSYAGRSSNGDNICSAYKTSRDGSSKWIPLDAALQEFKAIAMELLRAVPRLEGGYACSPGEGIEYNSLALD